MGTQVSGGRDPGGDTVAHEVNCKFALGAMGGCLRRWEVGKGGFASVYEVELVIPEGAECSLDEFGCLKMIIAENNIL